MHRNILRYETKDMKQFIVDVFSDQPFQGNPAAVCVLQEWIPDELMMSIARENNLSETAFAVKEGGSYHLRWFTPTQEIDGCGHATIGTGFVILNEYEKKDEVIFNTLAGKLKVTRKGDIYEMDFPTYPLKEIPVTDEMESVIGVRPFKAYMGRDLLCILDDEQAVRCMNPEDKDLLRLPGSLLHVTAPGKEYDCISRSFAPKVGIHEDPVCGSGHCHIIPYWAKTLNKAEITAYQASARGGELYCKQLKGRTLVGGKARLFSKAELFL